jgi:hypothetical protein
MNDKKATLRSKMGNFLRKTMSMAGKKLFIDMATPARHS